MTYHTKRYAKVNNMGIIRHRKGVKPNNLSRYSRNHPYRDYEPMSGYMAQLLLQSPASYEWQRKEFEEQMAYIMEHRTEINQGFGRCATGLTLVDGKLIATGNSNPVTE